MAANESDATARLRELLLSTDEIDRFLQQLAFTAAHELGPDVSCGITVRLDGRALITVGSDDDACSVDESQHENGPAAYSMLTGHVIVVEDMATDERWVDFRLKALGHGIRSSLTIPFPVHGKPVGVVTYYARHSHAFGEDERVRADRLVTEASRGVNLAVRMAHRVHLDENLATALASRTVIDQAAGVIMSQKHCTATEAYDLLGTIAQTRHVKLRDVATDIVTAISGTAPQRC